MTENIRLAIEKAKKTGNFKGAKKLLEEWYLVRDKEQWLKAKIEEHFKLYPEDKEYSNDDPYISFNSWLSETKVVKEATETEPEITELVRPYIQPTQEQIEQFVENNYLYKEAKKYLAKKKKQELLEAMKVELEDLKLQADTTSLVYMNAVGVVASKYFNKALADGISADDTYKAIYQDTMIDWRDADNVINPVSVETIIDVLELAIKKVGNVVKQDT